MDVLHQPKIDPDALHQPQLGPDDLHQQGRGGRDCFLNAAGLAGEVAAAWMLLGDAVAAREAATGQAILHELARRVVL